MSLPTSARSDIFIGALDGSRSRDLPLDRRTLSQLSYKCISQKR